MNDCSHDMAISTGKTMFRCVKCGATHRVDYETLETFRNYERQSFGPYQSDDPVVLSEAERSIMLTNRYGVA